MNLRKYFGLLLAASILLQLPAFARDKEVFYLGGAATDSYLTTGVNGDTVERFSVGDDGLLEWGAGGSSALDSSLYRAGAASLRTNSSLTIDGNLTVTGTSTMTGGAVNAPVAAGSSLTLTSAYSGKTILLDTASGSTVTLPAATGSGARFRFRIKTVATSNSHKIQVANGTDVIQGLIFTLSDDAGAVPKAWAAGASDDTITLNRSTTGSVTKGEYIEIEDVASGVFEVIGFTQSTGTEATPFSSAV